MLINIRKADGPKQFEASHAERFKALGLSEAAQYELSNILNTVWRIRYDPNAFTDPNWDKHYAEKLRILFGVCCSTYYILTFYRTLCRLAALKQCTNT